MGAGSETETMTTPFDALYWQEQEEDMYDDLLPLYMSALALGLDGGIDLLPPNIQPLVNPVKFNEQAAKWAKEYRYVYIHNIMETTRTQTQDIISGWIQSGASIDVLEAQLAGLYGESRAARIAATEVTRAFSQGNMEAWESTGFVRSAVWMTAQDELVCPICSSYEGEHVGIGDIDAAPPESSHPGCRCWLQPEVDVDLVLEQIDEILGL